MLPAKSSDFSNIVDKANVSFSCSIAFSDTNVSKSIQKFSPGVSSYPIPQSNPYFMILVIVLLEGSWRKGKARMKYNFTSSMFNWCSE